jgi:hypothetical protein
MLVTPEPGMKLEWVSGIRWHCPYPLVPPYNQATSLLLFFSSSLQRVVCVKKTDEAEEEGCGLTEDEIEVLSQGMSLCEVSIGGGGCKV